jgi:UDP-GlcNAc:undecaprenyl-phosphate GlcNAc-1-phosphate transferase
MVFPFNLYVSALGGAALTTLCCLPLWRAWARRSGLVDDPGHRKIHHRPVPLAGGLAVFTGMMAPLFTGIILLYWQLAPGNEFGLLRYGLSRRGTEILVILAVALGMVVLGWLDDRYELRPRIKFAGQLLLASMVATAGIRITLFVPSDTFSFAITVLWILTVTNAFNFMDNMNGLCAGLGAIAGFFFAVSGAIQGQYLVTTMALLMTGALLGFLPFNFPHASVFLGDAGSHLVGYLVAVMAVLPHFHNLQQPNRLAVISPLLILAVPLADLVWVVILRWRLGKPFYVGDNNHWSHRLVRRGWSRAGAVLLIWLAAVASGCLALALQGFGS